MGAGHLTLVFSLWFFFLDGRKGGRWREIVGNAIIFLPTWYTVLGLVVVGVVCE